METTTGNPRKSKENYDIQSKELLLTPIETLNLDKTETDRQVQNTIQAQAHWQLLYNALTELETLNQKQLKDQADDQTKQQALQKLAQQLPLEKAQKRHRLPAPAASTPRIRRKCRNPQTNINSRRTMPRMRQHQPPLYPA